ncbi:hypothetical protein Pth03_80030 [Planotetraspora thailandica]|uniref:PNPLA domain-containing protein n=1 Tax=Planotetraspora thailandica TaxID=487172 RepID=A0A8J3Y2N9_9ACTN|nr:patatin-like phospholipase family protein [Planotetraspora thailandica]GII59614.1 hypothetical protein Pth03_80030 [Planotetraspora thailandica]
MGTQATRRPVRRILKTVAALATTALVATACASTAPKAPDTAPTPARPRVGIILGGGGESGVAWQTGVLAALEDQAHLTPDVVDVVVGTSAGAVAGAYFSTKANLNQLVDNERAGKGASAPVQTGGGGAIPTDIMAALNSTKGTIEERDKKVGELAMKAPIPISSADFVNYIASMLPTKQWPALDFRATSVNAETGQTVLWKREDGVPLAAALASSSAVPGFLPTVEINGRHYTDAPRTSFSAGLVAEKHLDAIIYIGMPTPNLSNTIEEEALTKLEAGGLHVVRITGGAGSDAIIRNAMDPKIRPQAVETGLRDGAAAAGSVAKLLRP